MKKNLFSLLVFLCAFVVDAQTQTKSWSQINQRYEYFDSNRKLIGYETWNILSKQWEYYDARPSTNNNYTPQPYVSPYNLDLIKEAMIVKQAQVDQMKANLNELLGRIIAAKDEKDRAGYITESRAQWLRLLSSEMDSRINRNAEKFFNDVNYYNSTINWLLNMEDEIRKWDKPVASQRQQTILTQATSTINTSYETFDGYVSGNSAIYSEDRVGSRQIGNTTDGVIKIISKARGPFYKVLLANGQAGYVNEMWIRIP